MSKLFERLMEARGIGEDFLQPCYEDLTDPGVFPGMTEVVERIEQAVNRGEKVLIFGDYDADGVTTSTVMAEALELSGVAPEKIEIMLPDRFKDGYGMSPRAVERAREWGAKLVITVDTGSRNGEIIEELSKLGIDTIVTDHHECGEVSSRGDEADDSEVADSKMTGAKVDPAGGLTGAIALINPKRPDFPAEYTYLRDLAGVGVAFKVAQALVNKGLIRAGQEKWLLDLVLIGTVCDSMPLTGENRILGFYGMKVLAKTRRVGLRELMRKSGVKTLSSEAIGYQMGPRINAAGRLKTADLALKLVRAKSAVEAASLAEQLEELNQRRKHEQQIAVKEISERLKQGSEPVMIEVGDWHEGIIGIVAGRLVELYQKPAFVLTEVEDGVLKGSGRSFGDFSLAEAIDATGEVIIRGGGHAAAAGVSVKKENLPDFRAKINDFYRSLKLSDQERFLRQKADLEVSGLDEMTLSLLKEINRMEPFGEGNMRPIFRLTGVEIVEVSRIGAERNHLRLRLRDKQGNQLKVMAFFAPEEWLNLMPEDEIEPLVMLEKNDFQGVSSVEGRLIDLFRIN